jgi:hypothetical protein
MYILIHRVQYSRKNLPKKCLTNKTSNFEFIFLINVFYLYLLLFWEDMFLWKQTFEFSKMLCNYNKKNNVIEEKVNKLPPISL